MIGHHGTRAVLEKELPQATLLHGPNSIGKWTLARHLADHHHVASIDRWEVPHGLSVETVKLINSFAVRAPHGKFKLVVARLDGSNTRALNALLKTLEEPPPEVKFIFTCTGKPLATLVSRCESYPLGLLTTSELEDIYRAQGLPHHKVRRAATYARGQVERGFRAESADHYHNQVINLAKSLAVGDRDLFVAVFSNWDGRCTDMLTAFFTECLTHRWITFTENDSFGLHHDRTRLWRMVAAITRTPRARARLSVRAALEPFLTR